MSRVSENSSFHAIRNSVGKTKAKLEDLQVKGSNLKRVQKPSDDPIGNTDILAIRSKNIDAKQYLRNINLAKAQLTYTENALEDLSDIIFKAKEIAIGQSSNLFDEEIRQNVAKEVEQLRSHALGIANKRFGNKYVFSGFKTLTPAFNESGQYQGDNNQTRLEVSKDLFIPINFSGKDVFFEAEVDGPDQLKNTPIKNSPIQSPKDQKRDKGEIPNEPKINRGLASVDKLKFIEGVTAASEEEKAKEATATKAESRNSIFSHLEQLNTALLTNNHLVIQELLPQLDEDLNRVIQSRTKIGSVVNTIERAEDNIEREKLISAEYKNKIEDADVAELFTDLSRQQNVLQASYKASAQLMNNSLLDFIK